MLKLLSKAAWLPLVMLLAFGGVPLTYAVAAQDGRADTENTFAMINGERITRGEFKEFFARYARSKFYHRMPKERLAALRRDAANALVERRLLAREAARRGVTANTDAVDKKIAAFKSKYEKRDAWPKVQAQLPMLRQRMLESSKITALEQKIRHVDDPDGDALAAYYKRHVEKFTEPARDHLAVILVPVLPSAPRAGWEEAQRNADKLRALLQSGSQFADIAKQHSKHKSASAGGDLGFVHKGVLSAPAQKAVDSLDVGEITQPVRVLEGFVILRLIGRKLPEKRRFADVRDRVRALYVREESSRKWREFVTDLRKKADVVILDSDTPDKTK